MSLDGMIATPDHGLEWLDLVKPPEGSEQDYGFAEFMKGIDTVVLGRNTYDKVLGFEHWPYDGKKTVILSHRPIQPRHGERRMSCTMGDLLDELETTGSRAIYVEGGEMIQQALASGAVTSLVVSVIPVLLGAGIPLFGNLAEHLELKLQDARKFNTGLVQLRYLPKLT